MHTQMNQGRESENNQQFFNVFARGLELIFDCFVKKENETAKQIMIATILYADSQIERYKRNEKHILRTIDRETGEHKEYKLTINAMKEMSIEELMYAMGTKEKEAGIAPIQTYGTATAYEYLRKRGKV